MCASLWSQAQSSDRRRDLGKNDTGFFALEFVGAGELAAEEFDEAAGARAAVGAEQAHMIVRTRRRAGPK
jgi:hypothetical protein